MCWLSTVPVMVVVLGESYTHKPPLMFWLINASAKLTGGKFNNISGRLPTLLGAILALWAFSRLAAFLYDNKTAWRAFFILSTSFLFWHKGGTGQIDMLLLGLEMTALYYLFKSDGSNSARERIIAFSFMGLAVLAKGPVGLIVPVGIYITANVFAGGKKNVLKTFWLWGIPLALLWPGIWLVLIKLTGATNEFFYELLFKQNIGRAAGTFGGHYKPFYYYLQYIVIDFLPWSLFMPAAIILLINEKDLRKKSLMLTGWILFVIVFFSMSGGKRNLYILSVYPAASLLLASVLPLMKNLSQKWLKGTAYPVIILFLVIPVCGLAALSFMAHPFSITVLVPNTIIFIAGSILLYYIFLKYGLVQKWFNLLICIMILSEICIGSIVFPASNNYKTPVALAAAVKEILPDKQKLIMYRMDGEIFALYSDRRGKRIDELKDLSVEIEQSRKGAVIFKKDVWDEVKNELGKYGNTHNFQMESKDFVLLEYFYK